MRLLALLLALLADAALVAAPAGGAATPRASFNDLEDEVMCDVCNVPLNIAEAPRAEQQRREIRQLIGEGLTKEQIKTELVRRYGPAILATPEDHGFSLAAYLVPIGVVFPLIAGLALMLPRWRRQRSASDADGGDEPELDAADARRLEEDMARFGA